MQTATVEIAAPAETVPEIPAETLETIPTADKRLAASKLDRKATRDGRPRASVGRSTSGPRAWTMGGRVD